MELLLKGGLLMKKIKEMYLNSMKELKAPKNIALLGMLAALAVVLGFVASIEVGPYIRIGFHLCQTGLLTFCLGHL